MEVTLALGVAAFCLIAIFGLLPVGMNSNLNAVEQTTAASAAGSIIADLRAAGSGSTSAQFGIPLPTGPGSSKYSLFLREDGSWAAAAGASPAAAPGSNADLAQNPRYRVTLTFNPPPSSFPRSATGVAVLVTWPALADPTAGSVPAHFAGSLETVTALDRN